MPPLRLSRSAPARKANPNDVDPGRAAEGAGAARAQLDALDVAFKVFTKLVPTTGETSALHHDVSRVTCENAELAMKVEMLQKRVRELERAGKQEG